MPTRNTTNSPTTPAKIARTLIINPSSKSPTPKSPVKYQNLKLKSPGGGQLEFKFPLEYRIKSRSKNSSPLPSPNGDNTVESELEPKNSEALDTPETPTTPRRSNRKSSRSPELNNNNESSNRIFDLLETIDLFYNYFPEVRQSSHKFFRDKNSLLNYIENYDKLTDFVTKFNKACSTWKGLNQGSQAFSDKVQTKATGVLLNTLIEYSYDLSISYQAEKLNKYAAFSPETYGETKFDLTRLMLNKVYEFDSKLELNKNDVFVDIGSGVGNVVLQVAGSTHCGTCYGIEIDQTRHEMGLELVSEFKKRMRFFAKTHGKITLKQGDFTKDPEIKKLLQKARLIYINNFAFGAELNNSLKQILAECCSEGTAIVTSLCLVETKQDFKLTSRNLNDFKSMVDMVELGAGGVSWTDNPVTIFLHIINTTHINTFYQNGQKPFYIRHGKRDKEQKEKELKEKEQKEKSGQTEKDPQKDKELKVKSENVSTNSISEIMDRDRRHSGNSSRPVSRTASRSDSTSPKPPEKTVKKTKQKMNKNTADKSIQNNSDSKSNSKTDTKTDTQIDSKSASNSTILTSALNSVSISNPETSLNSTTDSSFSLPTPDFNPTDYPSQQLTPVRIVINSQSQNTHITTSTDTQDLSQFNDQSSQTEANSPETRKNISVESNDVFENSTVDSPVLTPTIGDNEDMQTDSPRNNAQNGTIQKNMPKNSPKNPPKKYGLSHDYLPPNFTQHDQLALNDLLNDVASSLIFNICQMRKTGFGTYINSMQSEIQAAEDSIELNLERLENYQQMIKTRSSSIARRMLRIADLAKVKVYPQAQPGSQSSSRIVKTINELSLSNVDYRLSEMNRENQILDEILQKRKQDLLEINNEADDYELKEGKSTKTEANKRKKLLEKEFKSDQKASIKLEKERNKVREKNLVLAERELKVQAESTKFQQRVDISRQTSFDIESEQRKKTGEELQKRAREEERKKIALEEKAKLGRIQILENNNRKRENHGRQIVNGQLVNGQLVNGNIANRQVLNGQVISGQVMHGQMVNGQFVTKQPINGTIVGNSNGIQVIQVNHSQPNLGQSVIQQLDFTAPDWGLEGAARINYVHKTKHKPTVGVLSGSPALPDAKRLKLDSPSEKFWNFD